jgi:hypothetical protein
MHEMVRDAGFLIVYSDNDVSDPELNFSGAASAEILKGWTARLGRMKKLREELGGEYTDFCTELLSHLRSESHGKRGNVRFIVAKKSNNQSHGCR